MKARPLLFSFFIFAFFVFHFSFVYGQWQWQNPLPQGNTLNDVFFINQNTGWTVGDAGTIMKSVDGGLSYDLINYPTHQNFSCVEFFNANTGLIAGSSGLILKTVDGGTSWGSHVP